MPLAVTQAGHQETTLRNIGRGYPTDQRHQQYGGSVLTPPQPEGVLFVAHKATALAGLEGATAQGGMVRGVTLSFFFLKPQQAAGKSVASMSATVWDQPAARSIRGSRSESLIARRPPTPTSERNSWSMRTPGTPCRLASRANSRQPRCSGSRATNWLNECDGVRTANKWSRHNCAALRLRCGPRLGRWLQCSLMKASGTYGSRSVRELGGTSRRKWRVHDPGDYSLRLYLSAKSGQERVSCTTCSLQITYTKTRNTLLEPLPTRMPSPASAVV